ncbi:MAG: hypothetical protein WBG37_18195 [Desulfobacterales bacterium]
MKNEQLLQHLKDLAHKLQITVVEHSFRNAGVPVKSGPCRIKGENYFILDKNVKVNIKISELAEYLADRPLEDIYLLPAVREALDRHSEPTP